MRWNILIAPTLQPHHVSPCYLSPALVFHTELDVTVIFICSNVFPLHENFELRPLGVAMGERRQRDPCLKYTYIKTPLVGRRQPMTSLPARPQYKGRRENTSSSSSSSLTVLFEACILVRVQFFLYHGEH